MLMLSGCEHNSEQVAAEVLGYTQVSWENLSGNEPQRSSHNPGTWLLITTACDIFCTFCIHISTHNIPDNEWSLTNSNHNLFIITLIITHTNRFGSDSWSTYVCETLILNDSHSYSLNETFEWNTWMIPIFMTPTFQHLNFSIFNPQLSIQNKTF